MLLFGGFAGIGFMAIVGSQSSINGRLIRNRSRLRAAFLLGRLGWRHIVF
jgi:hypothetical protein